MNKLNLKYNFGALVRLEENTGKNVEEVLGSLSDGKVSDVVQLLAAGLNKSFDETIEIVDQYIDDGGTMETLIAEVTEAITKSSLFGGKQPAPKSNKKPAAKKQA